MRDDTELEELNLEEEDEPDYEPGGNYGDDWEGGSPLKPGTVAIVFGILVILAAIICGILWRVTHADKSEGQNNASTWQSADNGNAGEDSSLQGTDTMPDGETTPGGSEPTETPEPEPEVTATPEPTPEVTATPEPTPEITATPQPTLEATATPRPVVTTDPNRVSTQDGRVIVFTDCDDIVTPKEYVNLRLEPSTSEGNATIHCRLNYGETVHRTGISEDSGWSRVEKDGVVCYVVTSLIYVPEG